MLSTCVAIAGSKIIGKGHVGFFIHNKIEKKSIFLETSIKSHVKKVFFNIFQNIYYGPQLQTHRLTCFLISDNPVCRNRDSQRTTFFHTVLHRAITSSVFFFFTLKKL